MSSKPAEARSIASQLILLFTPAAVLLLCCGVGVFYWMVVEHLFEEDNAVLSDKVAGLRSQIERDGGPHRLAEQLRSEGSGEQSVYYVRVLDPHGTVVAESAGMSDLLPPKVFPGTSVPSTATVPVDYRVAGKLYSLLATPVLIEGNAHTVQVAQDREVDEHFRKEFSLLLVIVLACGSLASVVIAITVTTRGLRPLAEMTRSLRRVGPTHLDERVAPGDWPRELQPVAIAFDDMLDRLEGSFTRLSQFSADLAHELRTPVANIRGEAEVALTRTRTAAEYQQVLESTVAECERLAGIIDNLLFLARAESADRQVQQTRFDGRAAVEKIAAYYQAVAEERQVTVNCEGNAEMYADPLLFGRAVSNLVDNALRFTGSRGRILISVARRDDSSEISVADTGSGIPADHLPRVFDRFYRADSSRNSQGTGLGLALVKSITDMHGGSATVKSEAGRGTTVTLRFPNGQNQSS